jgi:hypothetical protein
MRIEAESARLRSRGASKSHGLRGGFAFLTKPLITDAADDKLRT